MPIKPKRHANGIWYAHGTHGGRRIRQTLKTYDDKVAQEQCAHLEARLWKRDTFGEEAVRTFEEAALSYVEAGHDKRFVMPIATYFKGRLVGQIKPGDIKEAARLLYPQAKPATQNRQGITPAQAVINHAAQLGWCQPIKVARFKVEKVKRVFVDAEWLNAYMQEANASGHPHLSALALFIFQTGRPIGNALSLTWDDIDLSARTVFVGRPKTGIPTKTIRLSQQMVLALANLPRCQHVFKYSSRNSVYPTMRRICNRAGIPYVPPHQSGRHSFGTHTINSNINAKAVMETGGWKSARLFMETYVHPQDASRQVADMWDGKELAKPTAGRKLRS